MRERSSVFQKAAFVLAAAALVLIFSSVSKADCVRENVLDSLDAQGRSGDALALLEKADGMRKDAVDEAGVAKLVRAYEEVLAVDPQNKDALVNASLNSTLLGNIRTERKARQEAYRKGEEYALRALCLNPEFRKRYENGENPWDAVDSLGHDDLWGLGAYTIEIINLYASGPGMGVFLSDLFSGKLWALEKMMNSLKDWDLQDPTEKAAAYATAALVYCFPGFMGGDLEKAEEYFDKALEIDPNPYGAYHNKAITVDLFNGDKEAYVADLEKSLEGMVSVDEIMYPWAVNFRQDSEKRLADVDRYFVYKYPLGLGPKKKK